MKQHKAVFAMTITALAVACGSEPHEVSSATLAAPQGEVHEVQSYTLSTTSSVPGAVVAERRAEVATRMLARVEQMNYRVGQRVRAGEVLFRLDSDDVSGGAEAARLAVTAAELALEEAVKNAARMDTLYAQDVVPLVRRDQAHLQVSGARADVEMARAQLAQATTQLGYATVRAPFAGVVAARYLDEGDVASPGMPVMVIESDAREALFAVSRAMVSGLSAGDSVEVISVDGVHDFGRLLAVAGNADPMTGTFEVRSSVPEDWPSGTAVKGRFPAQGPRSVVAVPADAVESRGSLRGVHVVVDGGVELRWVRTGERFRRDGEELVEVISGLAAGERIAR